MKDDFHLKMSLRWRLPSQKKGLMLEWICTLVWVCVHICLTVDCMSWRVENFSKDRARASSPPGPFNRFNLLYFGFKTLLYLLVLSFMAKLTSRSLMMPWLTIFIETGFMILCSVLYLFFHNDAIQTIINAEYLMPHLSPDWSLYPGVCSSGWHKKNKCLSFQGLSTVLHTFSIFSSHSPEACVTWLPLSVCVCASVCLG